MGKSSGNFLSRLFKFLASIFGGSKPSEPVDQPQIPPDSTTEPAPIVTSKVLLLVYDPIVNAAEQKLSEAMNWQPVEQLVSGFMSDIVETSGGFARFQIVERVEVDEFPAKTDGFTYDAESYMDVLRGNVPQHQPERVDYQAILARFNILQRVADNEIDEVWIFAFPFAGLYESIMAGAGAFWCNAPPLRNTSSCSRRFVIMGFSYERGVGEMLESFGHRTESHMSKVFEKLQGDENLWNKFTRYDKIAPGKAEVGSIHFAPNSENDYDWNNPRVVPSYCDDWFNFPNFQGTVKQVNAGDWGNGDIRAHHKWWLRRIPRVAGRINGVHNDWWQYIMDPQRVKV